MKKLGLFIAVGALAWSMQACNSPKTDNNDMNNRDSSMYNGDSLNTVPPMNQPMDIDSMNDTMGTGDVNRADTTGTGRPSTTP